MDNLWRNGHERVAAALALRAAIIQAGDADEPPFPGLHQLPDEVVDQVARSVIQQLNYGDPASERLLTALVTALEARLGVDHQATLNALSALANLGRDLGDHSGRVEVIERVLASYDRQGRAEEALMASLALAMAQSEADDAEAALHTYASAYARAERMGRPELQSQVLRNWGIALKEAAAWHRQRHLLARRASLPAAPVQEQFARLRLIELLTGTHPRYLPDPLRLPGRSQNYDEFVFTMPEQMAFSLRQQARSLLSKASISEPVTWEPPFDWAAGIPWPGPDPDVIRPEDLHPLIRAGLPVRAIAARLATSADHVRLAAARHPAPQLPAGIPALPPAEPEPPGTEQLRDLTSQGYGPRKIARITGCSERAIRQLLTSAGLRQPAPLPDGGIDPRWLREQYRDRQRSLKDIAAETGVPVEALAAAARNAGIRVRHGIAGRAHPLAALGGPGAFPTDVWNAFTRPGAEQRIRRILALPGQPSLNHAARQLGIRNANLTSQLRQLETTVGTALLRTGPDGRLTLTAYGQLFARDVRPALESLAQSRNQTTRHAP